MTEAQAAEWISEHMTALYGYAFARLYNKSDVDDLVSEIICALLSSARRLRDDGAFHGFVWRTAENTFRKFIRRAARDGETWADDGRPERRVCAVGRGRVYGGRGKGPYAFSAPARAGAAFQNAP